MTSVLDDDEHYVTWRAAVAEAQAKNWVGLTPREKANFAIRRALFCRALSLHLPGARTVGACYRCLARVK